MSAVYASEKRALGICDRCGFQFRLKDLKSDIVKGRQTGIRVCGECFDIDHPQLFLGEKPIYDPQALRDARPDNAELSSVRGLTIQLTGINSFIGVRSFEVM